MTSTRRPEGERGRNVRWEDEDDRDLRHELGKKKRAGAGRESLWPLTWQELLPVAIGGGIGLFFLFPILLFPLFVFLTILVGLGISFVGFVAGCLCAKREGSFVAFDYLEGLGGLRYLVLFGFLGPYVAGYLVLWMIAQIKTAPNKPKAFLPWFGLQACGGVVIILGLITAFISDQMWRVLRPARPVAAGPNITPPNGAEAGQPKEPPKNEGEGAIKAKEPPKNKEEAPKGKEEPPKGKEEPPKDKGELPVKPKGPPKKPEPPAVTGDRELGRALADLGEKDGNAFLAAANRLARMKPKAHRPVVAKKIAEVLQGAPTYNHTALLRALGTWATAAQVPFLIELLDHEAINTRNEVLQVMGKLRDKRTVRPALRCFTQLSTTYHGEQALKEMGTVAETELAAVLSEPEKSLWVPAIRILKEIGTPRSLPALQAASEGDITTQAPAKEAIAAIQARTKK